MVVSEDLVAPTAQRLGEASKLGARLGGGTPGASMLDGGLLDASTAAGESMLAKRTTWNGSTTTVTSAKRAGRAGDRRAVTLVRVDRHHLDPLSQPGGIRAIQEPVAKWPVSGPG